MKRVYNGIFFSSGTTCILDRVFSNLDVIVLTIKGFMPYRIYSNLIYAPHNSSQYQYSGTVMNNSIVFHVVFGLNRCAWNQ